MTDLLRFRPKNSAAASGNQTAEESVIEFLQRTLPLTEEIDEAIRARAAETAQEYGALLASDPKAALSALPNYLNRIRTEGKTMPEALTGPRTGNMALLLNTVGSFYPALSREDRVFALKQALQGLDNLNYMYVQEIMSRIDEPWLVGDVLVKQPLFYAVPEHTYRDVLRSAAAWEDIPRAMEHAQSRFWLATCVIDTRLTGTGLRKNHRREQFYNTYPVLLDRTLDAAAAIAVRMAPYMEPKDHSVELRLASRLERDIDPALHDRVREKIAERTWIEF